MTNYRSDDAAYAVVLSGGYIDDEDSGTSFVYSGEGGQSGGNQVLQVRFQYPGFQKLQQTLWGCLGETFVTGVKVCNLTVLQLLKL